MSDGKHISIHTRHGVLSFRVGKQETLTPMRVGGINMHFGGPPQIFVQCTGESPLCHHTLALHPAFSTSGLTRNEMVDAVTDNQVGSVFESHGWQIVGRNGRKHTRCPECLDATPNPVALVKYEPDFTEDLRERMKAFAKTCYAKDSMELFRIISDKFKSEVKPVHHHRMYHEAAYIAMYMFFRYAKPSVTGELTPATQ